MQVGSKKSELFHKYALKVDYYIFFTNNYFNIGMFTYTIDYLI